MRGILYGTLLFLTVAAGVFFLSRADAARAVRNAITQGAGSALGAVWKGTSGILSWAGWKSGERASAWERERTSLLEEIARLSSLRSENEMLSQALALREEGEWGTLVSPVRAFFRAGQNEYLLLGKGFDDGIGVGDLVLSRERVLGGIVIETGNHFSRAELLTSVSRRTDVTVSGVTRAIAQGMNGREFSIELVPQDADVKRGDLVVASNRLTGTGRTFLLGEIREVRQAEHQVFKTVKAAHLFNPADGEVLVIPAP